MSVRVRYAPSPTGSPHVGNIRDALFKHLFAKRYGGVNILRIEDTDRTRYVPGCEEEIVESLNWMGIEFQEGFTQGGDHGPYRQSERKEQGIYQDLVQKLIDSGHAYWAFDTSEELEEMREFQKINKQAIGYYGGMWRDANPNQVEEAKRAGKPGVIRLAIPRDRTIVLEDVIRGRLEFDSNTVDDPVLIKADGMPTYHFAAMVDDHLMGITHIMRGEEWISSAPKHAWLFDAYGWDRPIFVHCPVIKGKDGSKLSKRHGDTRCLDYRSAGYLPAALANFIALIGWSPGGDRELMSMDEMAEAFSLEGLQPSPGVFDLDKLKWMNANHIRGLSSADLVAAVRGVAEDPEAEAYYRKAHEEREDPADKAIYLGLGTLRTALGEQTELAEKMIALEQERVTTLADFGAAGSFFFTDEPEIDSVALAKWKGQAHIPALFDAAIQYSGSDYEAFLKEYAAANGFEKLVPLQVPLRLGLTGKTSGPGLFDLMSALGPERIRVRLERAKGIFA